MPKANTVETYYEDGGWKNQAGDDEASEGFDTKEEAEEKGREMAKALHAEHVIKNKDGKIAEKNSYGNDPYPPRVKTTVQVTLPGPRSTATWTSEGRLARSTTIAASTAAVRPFDPNAALARTVSSAARCPVLPGTGLRMGAVSTSTAAVAATRARPVGSLVMGARTVQSIAADRKRCTIIDPEEVHWAKKIQPDVLVEAYGVQARRRLAAVLRVEAVCVHTSLVEVPVCEAGHDPALIRPHEPAWVPVLQAALTQGGRLDLNEAPAVRKPGWLVIDFALLEIAETAAEPAKKAIRNPLERRLAALNRHFHDQIHAPRAEDEDWGTTPELAALRAVQGAFDRTRKRILKAGGDPVSIGLADLDLDESELALALRLLPALAEPAASAA